MAKRLKGIKKQKQRQLEREAKKLNLVHSAEVQQHRQAKKELIDARAER